MDKFGLNYELNVSIDTGGVLNIKPPFTIEFDVTRNTLSSVNHCQIRIYNLNELNRNRLRFNIYNYGTYRGINLKAGYGSNLVDVFIGNISQAWSVREGTNFVTQIECYDGGFAFVNGQTNRQFGAFTPQSTILAALMQDLPNVSLGAIGSYLGASPRSVSYSGNSSQILGELTGGGFFIDNQKSFVLKDSEYYNAPGGVHVIDASSGLLGTPVLEQNVVRFDMLFEPQLKAGAAVFLKSITNDNVSGIYKVTGVKHKGTISDAVASSVVTTGQFLYNKILTPVGV